MPSPSLVPRLLPVFFFNDARRKAGVYSYACAIVPVAISKEQRHRQASTVRNIYIAALKPLYSPVLGIIGREGMNQCDPR